MFTRRVDELPPRIREVVEKAGVGAFCLALKTAFKPNATIPLIWMVLTSEGLLLCNTHRTRGLWGKYSRSQVPHIRSNATSWGTRYLEIEGGRSQTGPLTLPLPENMPSEQVDQFMAEYKRLRGH